MTQAMTDDLLSWFGDIDIYLFDLLLKRRLIPGMKVLDAGCGNGRNSVYMLRSGFLVHAVDTSAEAVSTIRELAAELAPSLPTDNFRVEPIEQLSFTDDVFDGVLCSAVLHFSRDEDHFAAMLRNLWRVLKEGGIFFARLASDIGLEHRVRPLGGRRFALPDGSQRFLVNEAMLLEATAQLSGEFIEPLKTTIVRNARCMTTWVLRKPL